MVIWQRCLMIHETKIAAGVAWAVKAAKYTEEKAGVPTRVLRNRFGDLLAIYFSAEFDSLDALTAWQDAFNTDPGLLEMSKEAIDQELYTGISDHVYRVVAGNGNWPS